MGDSFLCLKNGHQTQIIDPPMAIRFLKTMGIVSTYISKAYNNSGSQTLKLPPPPTPGAPFLHSAWRRPHPPLSLARTTAERRFTKPKMVSSPKDSPLWTSRERTTNTRDGPVLCHLTPSKNTCHAGVESANSEGSPNRPVNESGQMFVGSATCIH